MNTDNDCEYDESMRIFITTDKSFHATICQDVTTSPATKSIRIKGSDGYMEWHVNFDSQNDSVIYKKNNEDLKIKLFPKTRPDDFLPEVNHINQLINSPEMNSPIDLEIGIKSMKIVEAAFESFEKKSEVKNMNVLVTGGAGFVGSHLCEELLKDKNNVYVLDNYFSGSKKNHIHGCIYMKGETIESLEIFKDIKLDLIFHFGEYSRVEQSFDDIDLVFQYNWNSIYSILKLAKEKM